MSISTREETGFGRYVLPYMKSNMYLRIEGDSALLLDPHPSAEALGFLQEAGVSHLSILLTHEHFDHTCGVNFFRHHFVDVRVCAHAETAAWIRKPRNNRPLALLKMITEENREAVLQEYRSYPIEPILVDELLSDGETLSWHGHRIFVRYVPGHSPGSVLFRFGQRDVFSGDYMIPDTAVSLRYPGGSVQAYQEETLPILLDLPNECQIFPGHGVPYPRGAATYSAGAFCVDGSGRL